MSPQNPLLDTLAANNMPTLQHNRPILAVTNRIQLRANRTTFLIVRQIIHIGRRKRPQQSHGSIKQPLSLSGRVRVRGRQSRNLQVDIESTTSDQVDLVCRLRRERRGDVGIEKFFDVVVNVHGDCNGAWRVCVGSGIGVGGFNAVDNVIELSINSFADSGLKLRLSYADDVASLSLWGVRHRYMNWLLVELVECNCSYCETY